MDVPEDQCDPGRILVTVVLPCLNEEAGVAQSVSAALEGLRAAGVSGEVLVVDNGSSDRSIECASEAGARVIREANRGTGAATLAGIRAAHGEIIVTADADCTYDLRNLEQLVAPLFSGADLVVGNRLAGRMGGDAMPRLHRYLGTPALNLVLRALGGPSVSDSQSGYRAFRRDAALALGLRSAGFESVTELLIRAHRAGWKIREVPSNYAPREGQSKLRTWPDGWKHLRLLLVLCPDTTLALPGTVLLVTGVLLAVLSVAQPHGLQLAGLSWSPVFIGPMVTILGFEMILLSLLSGQRSGYESWAARRLHWHSRSSLGHGLAVCAVVAALGILCELGLFVLWVTGHSSSRMLGAAGSAHAMIVMGLVGVATLLASDRLYETVLDIPEATFTESQSSTPSIALDHAAATAHGALDEGALTSQN